MKILYKNQCLNLISATSPNFCEGCDLGVRGKYCNASPILTLVCAVTNKIFKQETKKDIFYES